MNKGVVPKARTQGLIRNVSAKSVPGASQYLPRFCHCYGQLTAVDPLFSLPNERSLFFPASLTLSIHFIFEGGGWRKAPIFCFLCSFVIRLWRIATSNHLENHSFKFLDSKLIELKYRTLSCVPREGVWVCSMSRERGTYGDLKTGMETGRHSEADPNSYFLPLPKHAWDISQPLFQVGVIKRLSSRHCSVTSNVWKLHT